MPAGEPAVSRREYLNEKFGRTGDLNEDINARAASAPDENAIGVSSTAQGAGPSRPGGYVTGDVDEHGLLSPQSNRAGGATNTKADNYVQSHHPIQDRWAQQNVPGYDRDAAPAMLLESASGMPHAQISAAQRSLRVRWESVMRE